VQEISPSRSTADACRPGRGSPISAKGDVSQGGGPVSLHDSQPARPRVSPEVGACGPTASLWMSRATTPSASIGKCAANGGRRIRRLCARLVSGARDFCARRTRQPCLDQHVGRPTQRTNEPRPSSMPLATSSGKRGAPPDTHALGAGCQRLRSPAMPSTRAGRAARRGCRQRVVVVATVHAVVRAGGGADAPRGARRLPIVEPGGPEEEPTRNNVDHLCATHAGPCQGPSPAGDPPSG
jgi:hypothetical protein